MEITSPPETRLVNYRDLDIYFAFRKDPLGVTLKDDDVMERTDDTIYIKFANGHEMEIFLDQVLVIETSTRTREEIVRESPQSFMAAGSKAVN